MTVTLPKSSKITQTTSRGLPCCLSWQRSRAERLDTTWSCWDECPRTRAEPWGGSRCRCCPAADFSAQRHSASARASSFSALPSLVSYDARSARLPWARKKVNSGTAAWPWHQGEDVVPGAKTSCSLPSLPGKSGPSWPMRDTICFLVYPPASQGNINKFADSRISWPHFFTCAKFSLGAVFLGCPCQRGVAPA